MAPEAVVELVMTGADSEMVKVTILLPVSRPALVAVTVELYVPFEVGVPDITPVLVFTLSPGGKPEAPKLVGELVAVMVYGVIATLVAPPAVAALVMTGTVDEMVRVTIRVAEPLALVAVTEGVYIPSAAGVPEITPVLVFSDSPAGNAVELKLVGELVAVMV